MLWKRMDLTWRLRCGLVLSVENHADWTIYNEIFVSGEYDVAIAEARRRKKQEEFRVLDLGANVGFFSLRAAEAHLQAGGTGETFLLTCVEGSPRTCEELKMRLGRNNLLLPNVQIVLGLVGGNKQGAAYFSDEFTHYGNSITNTKGKTNTVTYIDIEQHLSATNVIDLLKCDIEGAEFDFIDVYEQLLRRTRILVMEIHRYGKDVKALRKRVEGYGFLSPKILREESLFSVEMFAHAAL